MCYMLETLQPQDMRDSSSEYSKAGCEASTLCFLLATQCNCLRQVRNGVKATDPETVKSLQLTRDGHI